MELTLLKLQVEVVFPEFFQDLRDVVAMFGQVLGINKDVVDVHYNAIFHSSPTQIRTRLYALRRSRFEKMQAARISSRTAGTRGSEYGSLTV